MTDDYDPTMPAGPDGAPLNRPSPATPGAEIRLEGRRIDDFEIKQRLGAGAMGDVYLAEQILGSGTKQVALKTIRANWRADYTSVLRFQEEAYAGGTLKTPYVAQVFAAGTVAPTSGSDAAGVGSPGMPAVPLHYLVMEYCSGGSLLDYMKTFEGDRLPPAEGVRLLRQAAEGFLAAELRIGRDGEPDPLVHRDIKPANLLLQKLDGSDLPDLRISDFGAVKRLQRKPESPADPELSTTQVPMTPGYASPEQWEFAEVDHRSDMYSLGATFYHVLTGRRATPATRNLGELREFTMNAPNLSPKAVLEELPDPLNRVIQRMTARHQDDRYDSFADILADLRVFERTPVSTAKAWVSAALVLIVAGLAVWYWWPSTSYLATDLRDEYVALLADVHEVRQAAALEQLPGLRGRLDELARQAAEERDELERAIGQTATPVELPIEARDPWVRMQSDLGGLRDLIASATQALRRIEALEQPQTGHRGMSRQAAGAALAAISIPDGVPALKTRRRQLERKIADLFDERSTALTAIERDFVRGVGAQEAALTSRDRDPLTAVIARLTNYRETVALVEPELQGRVATLAAAIAGARQLEDRLPPSPFGGDREPLVQIDDAVAALRAVAELSVPSMPLLESWWESRRREIAAQWRPALVEVLQQQKARLGAANEQLRAARRQGLDAVALLRAATVEHRRTGAAFAELVRAIREVPEAGRVFVGNDTAEIVHEAQAGPAPRLDHEVARLRSEYRRVAAIADIVTAEVSRLRNHAVGGVAKDRDAIHAAIAALDQVQEARIAELEGHSMPAGFDRMFGAHVTNHLIALRRLFLRDELDLVATVASLRVLEDACESWSRDCLTETRSLRESIEQAATIVAEHGAVITPREEGGLDAQVEAFQRALAAIDAIRSLAIEDPDLRSWRDRWYGARLQQLVTRLQGQVQRAEAGVVDAIQKVLDSSVPELSKFDASLSRGLQEVARSALKLIEAGKAPSKPAEWSEAVWLRWPQHIHPPAGLFAELRDGVVVCSFAFRKRRTAEGGDVPVEMILIDAPGLRPFLIDRHEVCVGELLAYGIAKGSKDPGGYLARRGSHWRRSIGGTAAALLSWTSHAMATEFAEQAYGVRFALPSAAQWDRLVRSAEPLAPTPVSDPRGVVLQDLDTLAHGVRGLRSGLAEWIAGDALRHAGATCYAPASLESIANWKKGVGFRCVLNLQ